MRKRSQSIDSQVLKRIHGHGKGWVFTPASFLDLGSRVAVASALARQKRAGHVRQLARGLYDYPIEHANLGRVPPPADAVARAIAQRDAVRLQPAGAYAANVLGLSNQVPTKIVFLTDGPPRHVKLGRRDIVLKRTTPRNMATAGRKSGTVIQALRHVGQRHVDEEMLCILDRQLTATDRTQLRKDLRYAPAWIADLLRPLASGGLVAALRRGAAPHPLPTEAHIDPIALTEHGQRRPVESGMPGTFLAGSQNGRVG
jgi:hypothetical protein